MIKKGKYMFEGSQENIIRKQRQNDGDKYTSILDCRNVKITDQYRFSETWWNNGYVNLKDGNAEKVKIRMSVKSIHSGVKWHFDTLKEVQLSMVKSLFQLPGDKKVKLRVVGPRGEIDEWTEMPFGDFMELEDCKCRYEYKFRLDSQYMEKYKPVTVVYVDEKALRWIKQSPVFDVMKALQDYEPEEGEKSVELLFRDWLRSRPTFWKAMILTSDKRFAIKVASEKQMVLGAHVYTGSYGIADCTEEDGQDVLDITYATAGIDASTFYYLGCQRKDYKNEAEMYEEDSKKGYVRNGYVHRIVTFYYSTRDSLITGWV
jgi:hypothetical protein